LCEGAPNVVATLAELEDNAPAADLTHNPDLFTRIPARVALTIAGHTHGGQVAIPLNGRPVVPSDLAKDMQQGISWNKSGIFS
jgi:predicted MPP superfamily phosphohydrolase